ncbi:putative small GTPase, sigma-54 interaction domain, ATP-binding site 1 [Helianthus annuus]|nr:putative small GTPase, sigma-54 interaction domain, ATP-binding site 1 [Helianthus annuus]
MFWRGREREIIKEKNGLPPSGQVRVLVVGDSGVGKTSLVHLIVKGSSIARPAQTVGCTVDVKVCPHIFSPQLAFSTTTHESYAFIVILLQHFTYGSSSTSSSSSIKGDMDREFFVELWDVSGHDRYNDCRSMFYSQINGVIFVHDLSQRRTKTSLQKWAAEIAATGTFSAPLANGGPGGLPVPYIVIGNKADIASKEGRRNSSGNLVDIARQWVEKQGLLPPSEELPLTDSFPGSGGLLAAAKEARYDKESVMKFFRMLVRRRYYSDDLPTANPWSTIIQQPLQRSDDNLSDEDRIYSSTSQIGNVLPPLPAQRNLTPPPTLYPQQPVSTPENYNFPRFRPPELSSIRSKRTDINV